MDAVARLVALFSAYSSGDIDRVVSLIDAGASPFSRNDEGNTLFHLCCTNNTDGPRILERLLTLLASASARVLLVLYIKNNINGNTPLHLACINGVIGCVQSLLSRSPATDNIFEFTNNAGLSPLYYASKAGHIDIVTLAISWYGQFSIDNIIKCIDNAASWQIIQLLLMKITLRDMMDTCSKHEHTQHLLRLFPMDNECFQLSDGMTTVLHLAATSGDLEYFTTIVSLGFDINSLDSDGYTPLHRAIEYGCVSIAKYLISQPSCLCETLTKDNSTTPLLDAASELGDLSLVQGLVERGVDVNISNCNGSTALHCSCRWGHLSIVEYLTSLPQINYTKDFWGRTSIHFAAEFGQAHIVKYLVESCNHDINIDDKYGNTPLYMACIYNHLPVVEYLTGQPNCNINSNNERHPLLAATDKENLEIVKHLIASTDCDINVSEEGTWYTPLHKACYNGSLSIVEYLISKPQCNIEAIDNKLNKPLHYAACQGHKEIVSILGKKVSRDSLSECMESAKQQAEPDIMELLNGYFEDRLINACISGNVDIVHHLVIDKHCDVNAKGSHGYTPLHYACEKGHFEIVKILTNHSQCNIEAEDGFNDRPLHKACESGNVDIVCHLVIDKHCDVNAKGRNGYTPLHYACEKGHFEIVNFLTNHPQCNIEAEDNSDDRPLHKACESGNVDIVRHLVIDKHCDVNAKVGWSGFTPLHYACEKGHFEIVTFLTNHPQCNIEAENNFNDRPLHKACESGNVDIVRHLVIDKHCDVNAKRRDGNTPLHWACEKGHFEIVKILTDHPQCNIEAESGIFNDRPLHKACESGNVDIVRHLVFDKHCDVNAKGWNGYTPLHKACEKGHFEIVNFLTNHPLCNIEAENNFNDRPLHKACESRNVYIVHHLVIDKHCDVNAKGRNGYTPLHYACEKGHFEIVKILTNHPQCNIEAESGIFNDRPLHKACESGNVDIVRHLVFDKHCDVNAKGRNGYTPLHYACGKGHFEIVTFLTNHPQCNIEAENNFNDRPLHKACESGNVDIVRHLMIDKHCDVNAKRRDGNTPLHWACEKGHFEIVKILTDHPQCNIEAESGIFNDRPLHKACESGNVDIVRHLVFDKHCDVNAKGRNGYTPLHYACEKGHFEIVNFLTNHPLCNIEAENNFNDRPLHKACESRNVDIVRHLMIDKHCDVNAKRRDGNTLLRWACEKGHFEIVKILTNHPQCNIEAESGIFNDRPLHKACESGNVDIVHHLVFDKHCDVNAKGRNGYTPLHYACEKDHFEIVTFLTNHPLCNIEAENNFNDRPLHKACESGNVDIVRHLMIDKHCDVNAKRRDGNTLLHWACDNGHLEIVTFLTNHPLCNIEAENNFNDRPLHKACESGNVDIVRHLVTDKHCDVNAKGRNGYTPLHYACENGHFEIIKFLTNHPQCNIEAENEINDRPLHKARNVDIVHHLVIDKHCDVNAKGRNGLTPLHYACSMGNFEIVEFLTNHPQCNIEAENENNHRPLHLAWYNRNFKNYIDIVNYLIEVKGCNFEEIKDLHIYRSSGIALLRVVKCILTGPPGAGKSTLKKRLLNQSLDTSSSLSTGVIDAAVQVNSFRKLSQHNAVVTTEWKEQELDEEAVLISKKLLPANHISNESTRPTARHQSTSSFEDTETSFENQSRSPEEIDLSDQHDNTSVTSSPTLMLSEIIDATSYNEESSNMEYENVADSCGAPVNWEEEEARTDTEVQNNNSSTLKGFSKYVMKIPAKKRQEYEKNFEEGKDDNHTMLHIIDTGGQPEFHEILPALITGPAINLLVFKLTEDLRSRYEIVYRTSAGDSKPYETSLTHEEVIFRSLASIACLRQSTIGWSFDEIPIEDNSEPVAFLIATHRDQVDENKVSEVNQQLRTKIENSSHLFDSDLIQFSQSEQVIFPLDTTKDEEEVDHLRSFLHKVISKKFQELKIPASWCTLSLKLRKSRRNIFKYDTCLKLAKECGIKDKKEFNKVLWYLHHRVGIIMHYPNVAGLEDIIITDLQLVFDRITNLITKCFTFEQSGSAAVEREFRKNGRFSESQLDEMSSREKGDPLNTKKLVALLKHLYIVAGPMKAQVGRKSINYYFMPCALKPADVEREKRDGSVSPAPLLICFKCGYTPVGVFCCLVVYLLGQKTDQVLEWKLTGNDQYRNRITFQVGQYYDTVTLISRATYLEVWVQQQMSPSLNDLCDKILSSLHKGLDIVTQSLHYTYKSKHEFGVPCTCTGVPHPAVIEYCSGGAKCTNGNLMKLDEKHLYWSKKVMKKFIVCLHNLAIGC